MSRGRNEKEIVPISFIALFITICVYFKMNNSDSDVEEYFEGWEEDSDEDTEVRSLFCATTLANVKALIQHDLEVSVMCMIKCF